MPFVTVRRFPTAETADKGGLDWRMSEFFM